MKILLTAILLIGLAACSQPTKGDRTTMDFGSFTIETPHMWRPIVDNGIDSYVGRIAIDSTDTLSFDLGQYTNTLTEEGPMYVYQDKPQDSIAPYNEIAVFMSDGISEDIHRIDKDLSQLDRDKYRKQNVMWDTIDRRGAKIVYPRKPGNGITGVYFDSLWQSSFGTNRFNLYGKDLKPANEKLLLQAIHTLKFKKN